MIGLQTIGYARPRQLIINGDFQCWQRGESISFNDSNTPTNGFKYFADMWCTYFERGVSNNFTFEKVDNGVKVTTNKLINVNQFLIESLDSTKDYIFIVSINDTIHTLTFKGQETKENEFIKHMNQKDTGGYNRFIIKVNNNDIINYTNLFEGDIAYPHVKEDYATALMRCRRYIISGTDIATVRYAYDGSTSGTFFYLCTIKKQRMVHNNPTIETSYMYYNHDGTSSTGNCRILNVYTETINFYTQESKKMHDRCCGVTVDYLISCEP